VADVTLSVGIHGACGRMGRRLIQLIADDPGWKLAAALEREGHPDLGKDAGAAAGVTPLGVPVSSKLATGLAVDVMIDFSLPRGSLGVADVCQKRAIPLVVGTTGFSPAERKQLESASGRIPLLISPNMSRAVNLLMRLVREAAGSLGPSCDIAIVERHHRTKKDAPSGTALRLAEFAEQGKTLKGKSPDAAARTAQQTAADINICALRIADSPGEHTVVFGLPGETVELTHRAINRDGFALGALDAACFLAGKPPGLYSMDDVL
jgi:4-hydroxy-tetrahydrodipicolinate reductase